MAVLLILFIEVTLFYTSKFSRRDRDSNPEAAHHDQRFSRPPDYQLSHLSKFKKFPTSVIEQLTQRQIDFIFDVELLPQVFNPSPLLFTWKCRFSLLFPFTVSIWLLYQSQWPQSRVCHYKVFQLSIQYARWVLRILHHLIQTRPRKLYILK